MLLLKVFKYNVFSQVVAATQFVYEEAYIRKYDIPALKVVGWEGIWHSKILILVSDI